MTYTRTISWMIFAGAIALMVSPPVPWLWKYTPLWAAAVSGVCALLSRDAESSGDGICVGFLVFCVGLAFYASDDPIVGMIWQGLFTDMSSGSLEASMRITSALAASIAVTSIAGVLIWVRLQDSDQQEDLTILWSFAFFLGTWLLGSAPYVHGLAVCLLVLVLTWCLFQALLGPQKRYATLVYEDSEEPRPISEVASYWSYTPAAFSVMLTSVFGCLFGLCTMEYLDSNELSLRYLVTLLLACIAAGMVFAWHYVQEVRYHRAENYVSPLAERIVGYRQQFRHWMAIPKPSVRRRQRGRSFLAGAIVLFGSTYWFDLEMKTFALVLLATISAYALVAETSKEASD